MTQSERVLRWLKREPLTPLQAWANLGVYRLSARINDLRKQGWQIGTKMVEVENSYGEIFTVAEYKLTEGENNEPE